MKDNENNRKSLIDLFELPDSGLRGVFGLMCGLSADEQFMELALDRFSHSSKRIRAQTSPWLISLFLDCHNRPIQSLTGLNPIWPGKDWPKKTKLMHAKVALLGFGESVKGIPVYFRLIVSTGNWTKEAVNNSINLVWFCDYDTRNEDDQDQQATDILAAVSFWKRLLGFEIGFTGYYQLGDNPRKWIGSFLARVVDKIHQPGKMYSPRFIDNLSPSPGVGDSGYFKKDSVGSTVISRLSSSAGRKNLILCGSGFFEQAKDVQAADEPEVLQELTTTLQETILSKNPEKWLVINPDTSGAVGHWIKHGSPGSKGWKLFCPRHPDIKAEISDFHAKYILVANYRHSGDVSGGWLYLGSGNISKQGFAYGPSSFGNIEAGVVFEVGMNGRLREFGQLLGFDENMPLTADDLPDEIKDEGTEQDCSVFQLPPPIENCTWHPSTEKLSWEWFDTGWYDVILSDQQIHPPSQVDMSWTGKERDLSAGVMLQARKDDVDHEWIITVFTEAGTICASPMRIQKVHEIVDAILSFPAYFDAEEGEVQEEINHDPSVRVPVVSDRSVLDELRSDLDHFPLHSVTTLIEAIGEKNQQITEGQIPDWIDHLKRNLVESMDTDRKRKLSLFSKEFTDALVKGVGFAPPFISKEYRKAIKEIANNWCIA